MYDFNGKYSDYLNDFNSRLDEFCSRLDCKPKILCESLKYSLLIGGKRIRPVLMLAVGELLGVEKDKLYNFAIALELIHTYSLIHDDLPDMDNDDFRRGKPSNHKVFGAGNAILAGDGLLNTAYSLLFEQCYNGNEYISAAKYISECAGINGMIAGQSADLLYENCKDADETTLDYIYENKTAKLISAAVVVPSILCGNKYCVEMKEFGSALGYLFQLTDDILDVEGSFEQLGKSTGKDEAEKKFTCVSLYGLEHSKLKADLVCDRCYAILDCIQGDVNFLRNMVENIRTRIK